MYGNGSVSSGAESVVSKNFVDALGGGGGGTTEGAAPAAEATADVAAAAAIIGVWLPAYLSRRSRRTGRISIALIVSARRQNRQPASVS